MMMRSPVLLFTCSAVLLLSGCAERPVQGLVSGEYAALLRQRERYSSQLTDKIERQNEIILGQYDALEEQLRVYTEREARRVELAKRLPALQASLTAQVAQLAAVEAKSEAARALLAEKEAAIKTTTALIAALNQQEPALKMEYAFLSGPSQIEKLAAREAQLAKQIGAATRLAAGREAQLAAAKAKGAAVEGLIAKAKAQARLLAAAEPKAKKEFDFLSQAGQEAALAAREAALAKSVAEATARVKTDAAAEGTLKRSLNEQAKRLAGLRAKIGTLTAAYPKIKQEFDFLATAEQAAKLAEREKQIALGLGEIEKRIASQEPQLKEAEARLSARQAPILALNAQVAQADEKINRLKTVLADKERQEVGPLRAQIQQMNAKIAVLQAKWPALKSRRELLAALTGKIADLALLSHRSALQAKRIAELSARLGQAEPGPGVASGD